LATIDATKPSVEYWILCVMKRRDHFKYWPAPGSEDTELGVLMGPEVGHGEAEVHARVQA
jgi:hypothetical protein